MINYKKRLLKHLCLILISLLISGTANAQFYPAEKQSIPTTIYVSKIPFRGLVAEQVTIDCYVLTKNENADNAICSSLNVKEADYNAKSRDYWKDKYENRYHGDPVVVGAICFGLGCITAVALSHK